MNDDRQKLISAARETAVRLGVARLTLSVFQRETGIYPNRVYELFGSWPALCLQAGLSCGGQLPRVPDEAIFEAMDKAFAAAGEVCSLTQVLSEAPFSKMVMRSRFGTWLALLTQFRHWARVHRRDAPYMAALNARVDPARGKKKEKKTARQRRAAAVPSWPARGRRQCGAPIDFRGLLFAPVNEQGVVLLFGMVAEELGYRVETVATGFPDCTARRHVGGGRWEAVAIEFEYRSRSFQHHGHDVEACDLIVCWEHDWADCPLEVLALADSVPALRQDTVGEETVCR